MAFCHARDIIALAAVRQHALLPERTQAIELVAAVVDIAYLAEQPCADGTRKRVEVDVGGTTGRA